MADGFLGESRTGQRLSDSAASLRRSFAQGSGKRARSLRLQIKKCGCCRVTNFSGLIVKRARDTTESIVASNSRHFSQSRFAFFGIRAAQALQNLRGNTRVVFGGGNS